jgi:DNA-binding transcriptional MerR regulator
VTPFAKLAGVTVRTLHHYDRLGLLRPAGRSAAGYRIYTDRDLGRLQQIVTLKFIGLSLETIRELLDRGPSDIETRLARQREVLEERRRQLDAAVAAVREAERVVASGEDPVEALARIIEVIEMQKNWDWVKKYYTDEQLADLASRWSPEVQARAERDWAELIADVKDAVGEDPAGERAQALAARWADLINQFTGGDAGIRENLQRVYTEGSFEKPYPDDVGAFIAKAMAARASKPE